MQCSSLMTGRLPMHVTEDNDNAGTIMGAVPPNMLVILNYRCGDRLQDNDRSEAASGWLQHSPGE